MFGIQYTRDPADDIVLDDPRWEAPSLLIPGVKPTGPVEIDWGHELSVGLSTYVLFQPHGATDLVSRRFLTRNNTSPFESYGQKFNGTSDYFILPDVTINSQWSIVAPVRSRALTGSDFQYWFSWGTILSANSINSYYYDSGGRLQVTLTDTSLSNSLNLDAWFGLHNGKVAAAVVDGTSGELFVDSVSVHTMAYPAGVSDGSTNDLYLGAREDLNGDRFYDGWLTYVAIYDRLLSKSEIAALARNPYQFLIPA